MAGCAETFNPACGNGERHAGRDGLPRRRGHPQLLGLRARLRAPGPHVRVRRLLEPALPSVHGLGVVGLLLAAGRPSQLPKRHREPAEPARLRAQARRRRCRPNPNYAWTDLTYLLHKYGRELGATTCSRAPSPTATATPRCRARRSARTPRPRASGTRCRTSPTSSRTTSSGNIQSLSELLRRRPRRGTCPAVSWIVPERDGVRAPAGSDQRRPDLRHRPRQRDHAEPRLEQHGDLPGLGRLGRLLRPRGAAERRRTGYGLRVPGLVISPYARQGYIDHQTLSFDAYVKFIEDDFLGGQRLEPADRRSSGSAPRRARGRARSWATCGTTSTSTSRRAPPVILPVQPADRSDRRRPAPHAASGPRGARSRCPAPGRCAPFELGVAGAYAWGSRQSTLNAELASGKRLRSIARTYGVTVAALRRAVLSALRDEITRAVL